MPRRVIAWSLTFVTSRGLKKDMVKISLRSASGWELITLNGRGVVHAILLGSILRPVLSPGLPSDSRLTGSHPICKRRTPRIFPFVIIHSSIVYSWGVLHHSPDTQRAFSEAHRVLRPGGTLRVMVYHRPSVVGLMLWARYGLATGHPTRSLTEVYARHLESPGTKGYTIAEARSLVAPFGACKIRSAVSFGDLLLGEVGQQHVGIRLTLAKRFWPRPFIRRLPMLGLLLLIEARK